MDRDRLSDPDVLEALEDAATLLRLAVVTESWTLAAQAGESFGRLRVLVDAKSEEDRASLLGLVREVASAGFGPVHG